MVVGAFGEGSDDHHSLIHHLAISRVRVAGPQKGTRGQVRSEEALAITSNHLVPEEDPVRGWSEGPSKAVAGQA